MDNLLLLLVFLVTINIWMTRGKAIKKVEQAKIKRAQQNETNPIQHKNVQIVQGEIPVTNQKKSIIEVKQKKQGNTVQTKSIKQGQKENNKIIVNEDVIEKETNWRDDYFSANTDIDFDKSAAEIKTSYRASSINIKKDLLNGIIFSEILSEPKSIKSGERGM